MCERIAFLQSARLKNHLDVHHHETFGDTVFQLGYYLVLPRSITRYRLAEAQR